MTTPVSTARPEPSRGAEAPFLHAITSANTRCKCSYRGEFRRRKDLEEASRSSARRPKSGPAEPATRLVKLVPASKIKVKPVHWLWDNRIPLGELTLLAGREGIAKSTIAFLARPGNCSGGDRSVCRPEGRPDHVHGLLQQWSQRQVWVAGTRRSTDITARSVTFGGVPLRSLRRSHIEGWVKSMSSRGLGASTIVTRANNVRAVLRGAVADRVIPVDPSAGVTLPRRRRRQAVMAVPTAADVKKVLDGADLSFSAFVGLCDFAGLRPAEATVVQIGDVDFLRLTLNVARQVQRIPGGYEIRAPKYGIERQVFLAPSLVSMLSELLASSVPDGEEPDPADWLFTGEADEPPQPNTVNHRWRMARKRAGVGPIRLHDMRHLYASGLIGAGCDVVTPASPRPRQRHDDAEHLQPSVADG